MYFTIVLEKKILSSYIWISSPLCDATLSVRRSAADFTGSADGWRVRETRVQPLIVRHCSFGRRYINSNCATIRRRRWPMTNDAFYERIYYARTTAAAGRRCCRVAHTTATWSSAEDRRRRPGSDRSRRVRPDPPAPAVGRPRNVGGRQTTGSRRRYLLR